MPSSQTENYGRVFILKDGNWKEKAKHLQSAYFSNVDMKWYDLYGDIHSEFKNYNNCNFSLGFNIRNLNKMGQIETFHGKFMTSLALGEIGFPDVEYLKDISSEEINCAKKIRLITRAKTDSISKVIEKSQVGSIFVLMTPGQTIIRQSEFFLNLGLLLMFDDLVDDKAETERVAEIHRSLLYQQQSKLLSPVFDLFKGRNSSAVSNKMDAMAIAQTLDLPAHLVVKFNRYNNSFIKLATAIYYEALKHGSASEAEPFFTSLMEAMEAVVFQHCTEWNKRSEQSLMQEQVELCKITSSAKMAAEAIAFVRGIHLKEEIRSSFLFKRLLHELATHTGKVNDLLSYHKEVTEDKDCNNEIYILHFIKDWPLEDALRKVLDDANNSIRSITEMSTILLGMFDHDENLSHYIQIVKEVICGHLQWCAYTKRYHPTMVYDCHIIENLIQ